jgi:hypothetical protein
VTARTLMFSISQHSAIGTEQAGVDRSKTNSLRHAPPHSDRWTERKPIADTVLTVRLRPLRPNTAKQDTQCRSVPLYFAVSVPPRCHHSRGAPACAYF